jgi:hypothetical protein
VGLILREDLVERSRAPIPREARSDLEITFRIVRPAL